MSCQSAEVWQEALQVQEIHRKKFQLYGVNFYRFTAILVLKNQTNNYGALKLNRKNLSFRYEFSLIYRDFSALTINNLKKKQF